MRILKLYIKLVFSVETLSWILKFPCGFTADCVPNWSLILTPSLAKLPTSSSAVLLLLLLLDYLLNFPPAHNWLWSHASQVSKHPSGQPTHTHTRTRAHLKPCPPNDLARQLLILINLNGGPNGRAWAEAAQPKALSLSLPPSLFPAFQLMI